MWEIMLVSSEQKLIQKGGIDYYINKLGIIKQYNFCNDDVIVKGSQLRWVWDTTVVQLSPSYYDALNRLWTWLIPLQGH